MAAANNCSTGTISSPIKNCVQYWNAIDTVTATQPSPLQCRMCASGYHAEVDLTATNNSKKYRCRTGDGGIANCEYAGKYIFANGKILRYCMGCAEGYIGQDYNAFVGAPTSCNKNAAKTACVTNCAYCSMNGPGSHLCWACKNGFVASNDGSSCIAETTSTKNCQNLNAAGTQCETCWWPYYFQGQSCLKSN